MSEDLGARLSAKLNEQRREQEVQSAPESLLIQRIKAHIHKGEQAKERAAQNQKKSEDHFIAAGRYLAILKANHAPTWAAWETLLKAKIGLSTGRASELMQIADGRKTVEQVRADTSQRVRALRAETSSLHGPRNEETIGVDHGGITFIGTKGDIAETRATCCAFMLIDALVNSTPEIRSAASPNC